MYEVIERRDLPLTVRMFDEFPTEEFFMEPYFPTFTENSQLMMIDKGRELLIHADIPGMRREEISVSTDGETLSICGEHKAGRKGRKNGRNYNGRYEESFSECVRLPAGVKTEGMRASFKDGVLEIRMPKAGNGKVHKVTVH